MTTPRPAVPGTPGTAGPVTGPARPPGAAGPGPTGTDQATGAGGRSGSRRGGLAIVVAAAAILAVLLLQSLLHGHLTGNDEYDDGVYFGASLQLTHAILPYRDFAFIQPPMITVLLAPFAALSGLTGTAAGFEAARIFTDLAATADVVLAGLLVRHRPVLQVLVTTGILAAFPATVRAAQTVLLEPFAVLLCLAGLVCLFDRDKVTTSRWRLTACGVLFGMAGATKLWAGLPFLAVLCIAWPAGPPARRRLVAGAGAGLLGCVLPFAATGPAGFARQVLVTQAIRNSGGYPLESRLADLTGLPGLYSLLAADPVRGVIVLAITAAVLTALCVAAYAGVGRESLTPLDRFALVATLITVAGLLGSPTYYYHYAAFAAPFICLLYGIVVLRLRTRLPAGAAVTAATAALPVLLICVMLALRVDAIVSARPAVQAGALSRQIPARGCVLALDPALAILADRFTGDVPGCPQEVDWLAEQRVLDHGRAQAGSDRASPAVQAEFLRWLRASGAVIGPAASPAWGPAVTAYLRGFRREPGIARDIYAYLRTAPRDYPEVRLR